MLISEMNDEQKRKIKHFDCSKIWCDDCVCFLLNYSINEQINFSKYRCTCLSQIMKDGGLCKKEEQLIDIDISKLE